MSLLRHYILDEDNRPVKCSLFQWAAWFERVENRRVGFTQINSEVEVSTVFLGIDHRWDGSGPPLLFETAMFTGNDSEIVARYSSWDDAKAGHDALVNRLRRKQARRERIE